MEKYRQRQLERGAGGREEKTEERVEQELTELTEMISDETSVSSVCSCEKVQECKSRLLTPLTLELFYTFTLKHLDAVGLSTL